MVINCYSYQMLTNIFLTIGSIFSHLKNRMFMVLRMVQMKWSLSLFTILSEVPSTSWPHTHFLNLHTVTSLFPNSNPFLVSFPYQSLTDLIPQETSIDTLFFLPYLFGHIIVMSYGAANSQMYFLLYYYLSIVQES